MAMCLDPELSARLAKLGFREDPFSEFVDPRFLYLGQHHVKAAWSIIRNLRERRGITCVTGNIGSGKTILAKWLFQLILASPGFRAVHVQGSDLSSEGSLYTALTASFLSEKPREVTRRFARVEDYLRQAYQRDITPVLLIDQAEMTRDEGMQAVQKIANIRGDNLAQLQLVLLGQSKYLDPLRTTQLLRDRSGYLVELNPLPQEEVRGLIHFRCQVAGRSPIFSEDAIAETFNATYGIPGTVVQLGRMVLKALFWRNKDFADGDDVRHVLSIIDDVRAK